MIESVGIININALQSNYIRASECEYRYNKTFFFQGHTDLETPYSKDLVNIVHTLSRVRERIIHLTDGNFFVLYRKPILRNAFN